MKILVIGRYYDEAFASFIARELVNLGHEVVKYDPGPTLPLAFGSRARFYINRITSIGHEMLKTTRHILGVGGQQKALARAIEQSGHLDIVLSSHDYLTPRDAALVKQLSKAPLALWYPDPIWSFQRHMFLNAPYDFLFFKDPYLVDLLRRKLGVRAYYLPECYSPGSLDEQPVGSADSKYVVDLCTAGNVYSYRVAFFKNLADRNVKIWGLPAPLWMELGVVKPMIQNQFVAHADKVKAFRGAKIVLNNLNPAEIWGTNVRTFEICGAGGFQLVDGRPGLSQLFELGRELVAFDDLADLRAKLDYYLNAPEERDKIAAAGHRRALRDHTYAHRLRLLLETVQSRAEGFPMPRVTISA
jgi:spore maturation protein CgeB